jgi:hypothetical protein
MHIGGLLSHKDTARLITEIRPTGDNWDSIAAHFDGIDPALLNLRV